MITKAVQSRQGRLRPPIQASVVPCGTIPIASPVTRDWRPGLLSVVPTGLSWERIVLTQTLKTVPFNASTLRLYRRPRKARAKDKHPDLVTQRLRRQRSQDPPSSLRGGDGPPISGWGIRKRACLQPWPWRHRSGRSNGRTRYRGQWCQGHKA
jgi:hypothetical protein